MSAMRHVSASMVLIVGLCACRSGSEPRFQKDEAKSVATSPSQETVAHAEDKASTLSDKQTTSSGSASNTSEQAQPASKNGAPALTETGDGAAAEPPKPRFVRMPTSPDPLAGKFTLKEATAGLPGKGKLHATIDTQLGTIECDLFDDKTPTTVANFVGLARGLRPFWDAKEAAWVKRPLYDGTSFHRAIADFMIQGGDHLGDGSGQVGYEIPDELVAGLSHDRAGLLCMANRGKNTNGGQFFITDAATPHLTQMGSYSIFGECKPLDVIHSIATAPRPQPFSERPEPPVAIRSVKITRR